MTLIEALDFIKDINETVSWKEDQQQEQDFFESVGEMLEELKILKGEEK